MTNYLATPRHSGRVVVLHGYGASPSDHWFPWLTLELAADDIDVVVPRLPDSQSPKAGRWIEAARAAMQPLGPDTVVVGHSLGTITALKALEGQSGPWRLAGLILVAGFDRALPDLPELRDFTATSMDYMPLASRIPSRHVLVSTTDTTVPPDYSRDLARRLGAQAHVVPGAGHFLGRDGFTRLPLVAELARAALRGPAAVAYSGH